MIKGTLIVCVALLVFAGGVYASGKYQRTADNKAVVWNNNPEPGDTASWSGDEDADGFATGYGTLTWTKVDRKTETGTLIPTNRKPVPVIARFSGKMVRGKLEGEVETQDAQNNTVHAKFVGGRRTEAWTAGSVAAASHENPRSSPDNSAVSEATPRPSPGLRPQEQVKTKPITGTPTQANDSIRSLVAPPASLRAGAATPSTPAEPIVPDPPPPPARALNSVPAASSSPVAIEPSVPAVPSSSAAPLLPSNATDDAATVAALDTRYQAAVKAGDATTMDRILADDFILVTGRGGTSTKADLMKEARQKQLIYEHQEEEKGTQKVRVWGDTAVVTAQLWIKGTGHGEAFDHKLWFSDTYRRTPTGWRYVFGQASLPLPQASAK